jgi:DnaK suppressor protein
MEPHSSEAPRSPLNQAVLDRLRLRLEHERQRLIQEIRQRAGGYEIPDLDDPGDDADLAVRTAPSEVDDQLLAQYDQQLRQVEAAIQRMESGAYGINPRTGELIPIERLEAVPWATE